MDFPEDDPKLIARHILFLYTKYYPHEIGDRDVHASLEANEVWFKCLRALLSPSDDIFVHEREVEIFEEWSADGLATDATMHALADRFDVPKLAFEARKNYLRAKMVLEDYRCPRDFVQSVKVVYTTTRSTDRRLRDIALYAVQQDLESLRKSENETDDHEGNQIIRRLLVSTPQYALELLTIDLGLCHIWCEKCQMKYFCATSPCACGMRGVCGNESCTDEDWSNMTCKFCDNVGICRKAAPEDRRPWRSIEAW